VEDFIEPEGEGNKKLVMPDTNLIRMHGLALT
jgi:hypothetical protein